MPGGIYDSSKTRVQPVLDAISSKGENWAERLLALLPSYGASLQGAGHLDLKPLESFWGRNEAKLPPPVSLLSWLIRNVPSAGPGRTYCDRRRALLNREPGMVRVALDALRSNPSDKGWFIFEGLTQPDVFVVTGDALIVVEGKRTEKTPTTRTTWMDNRHQIWRHIDAAWEIRGSRRVFGFFIVESSDLSVPSAWEEFAAHALSKEVMAGSFPHRSPEERSEIAKCLVGVTTWRRVCAEFGFPYDSLPDKVGE